ncbi:MAG: DPP IV N-terminal domain-containing protein, partial [Planctomycetota bacterium]|nr:DPP IV N-terminal domain-containing protein [Planctomycetota bacterium]
MQLKTVAEKSNFSATCRHDELLAFQQDLAREVEHVTNMEIGKTVNGRSMQATVVAQPAYRLGDRAEKRLLILLLGNIHSGECAGKEGLLMLLRELAADAAHPWLEKSVIVCLPNYNADGNDRIGRNEIHRPGQMGPSAGMGLRENAQQLDLNRDFMKIESPEARALVRLIDHLNPHLFIDCHTTNGSKHRYALTYDIPHNPTTPKSLRDFMRGRMMPSVTRSLEEKKLSTFYYGNFSRDQTRWTTYGHEPRYSTEYVGLRGRLSILSEAYSYIPYRERILASREFVRECIQYVVDHSEDVQELLGKIEKDAAKGGKELSLAAEVRPFPEKFTLKGYEGNSDRPKDVEVEFFGDYIATRKKVIPDGYILAPKHGRAVDRLLMHGIRVSRLQADAILSVERFSVRDRKRSRVFQKHAMLSLTGEWQGRREKINAGCYFVSTAQPLGRLAAYLLEPESNDGLVTWNFFDSTLETGGPFPVIAFQGNADALDLEDVVEVAPRRQLTLDELYGLQGKIDFGGTPASDLEWVSDNRYRTRWNGRPVVVDAQTGKLERPPSLSSRVIQSRLVNSVGLPMELAALVSAGKQVEVEGGIVVNGGGDLYWISNGESGARRLTADEQVEELVTASPDGKQLAFVKSNDLYRLVVKDGTLVRLTRSGSENRLNGKLDWVYQEELYGRGNFKGFWWSPDSSSLAYLRLNQQEVKRYQVTDHIPVRQSHEIYPYPKAGDPNPTVELFVEDQSLDLKPFGINEPLISQVCWGPDNAVYLQLQNRIQNRMNLVRWRPGEPAKVLVSESVEKGWIDSPGNPLWPEGQDGFVWFTHRNGKRQIASYSPGGKLLESGQAKTHPKGSGIEVRELLGADREAVYFLAANPADVTRLQLYCLTSDGRSRMITNPGLNHTVKVNPSLSYFFDYESSVNMPTRVALRQMDGSFVRYVEPNLVDHLDYYDIASPVFQRVPTRDGDQMDSMLILPPDFDESKKYPVLMHVYSGPQAPRVRN